MLKLYNYYRSSASFRVRIALNLKNIEYQDIPIHLTNQGGEHFLPSFNEINPQNLVPVLCDNNKVITQSLAIIEYIDALFPSPAILPKDPYQSALIKSFALTIAADVHPLNNLRVLKYLTTNLGLSEDQKNTWYQNWIQKGFTALEKQLTQLNRSGKYCFGDSITLADIFLVPQMYNARRFSCDISQYPLLTQIDHNCQQHPAFIKASPNEQKQ